MIKRANMVKLLTKDGYSCTFVTLNSCISEGELRNILSNCGGSDCGEYCWFHDMQSYRTAIEILNKRRGVFKI